MFLYRIDPFIISNIEIMTSKTMPLIATCASGLELLLVDEISSLGGESIGQSPGAVRFEGTLETAYRACLWSRFASRILLLIAECHAEDTDELYNGCKGIDWYEHLAPEQSLAVDCASSNSSIKHTKFASLRVKDAIVDQFRDRFKQRPNVDTKRPDIRISLYLKGETAYIRRDLSGESLHRRGYRGIGGAAPLKESLAAAIVSLSGWHENVGSEDVLLDPMCGSGTLLIEAAHIFGDIAPGLGRDYFGFLGWDGHDKILWERLIAEAEDRKKKGLGRNWPRIIGFDADKDIVRIAVENIGQAGMTGIIHIERRDLAWLENPFLKKGGETGTGLMVSNPPYGERMSSANEAKYLYRFLAARLAEKFDGWKAGIFCGNTELFDAMDMSFKEKYRLFNGPIPCQLRIFDVSSEKEGPRKIQEGLAGDITTTQESHPFANRLRKNMKRLSKWVKRESISCYRLYDADIPEYNVAVDVYGPWVHVQEYAPPKNIDMDKAAQRMSEVLRNVRESLGVKRNMVFVKVRHRQKGRSQYQKQADKRRLHVVSEHGSRFLVNLLDYLDTGIFLDHRDVRKMIRDGAKDKRFLNLFGYTGTATVQAAAGGAKTTTTIDLSPTYLKWARSNLALNGFSETCHKVVQSDCMEYLSKSRKTFDLIFVDPPTFSNSKRTKTVFDVQKDHAALIRAAMKRLEPEGLLIFSTNSKKFKLDQKDISKFDIKDITKASIPRDFERNQRIHHCWEIRHKK
jgi:23S rRNA (guanine2445-N2)-methyltransferase / 23S rRNA (guanine2069-N7)-methyltransferase